MEQMTKAKLEVKVATMQTIINHGRSLGNIFHELLGDDRRRCQASDRMMMMTTIAMTRLVMARLQ